MLDQKRQYRREDSDDAVFEFSALYLSMILEECHKQLLCEFELCCHDESLEEQRTKWQLSVIGILFSTVSTTMQ